MPAVNDVAAGQGTRSVSRTPAAKNPTRIRGRRIAKIPTHAHRPGATIGSLIRTHLALVVSAALAAWSALQVMAVASWNEETAQAIIQEQGSVQILTGTLLSIAVDFTSLALLAGLVLPFARMAGMEVRLARSACWIIFGVSLAMSLIGLPLPVLLLTAVFWVAIVAGICAGRRGRAKASRNGGQSDKSLSSETRTSMLHGMLVLLILMIGLTLVDRDPWMPRENITFTNDRVVAGYVLNTTPDELVYINADSPRLVTRSPSSDIRGRDLCQWGNPWPWSHTVLALISGDIDSYVRCARDE